MCVTTHLQQVIVAKHVVQLGVFGHVLSVCEDDVPLDSGESALHLDHKVDKGGIQHNVLILGMVDNILQLLLKQPADVHHMRLHQLHVTYCCFVACFLGLPYMSHKNLCNAGEHRCGEHKENDLVFCLFDL